eukprot:m.185103 g.185103  ORF g.185103 m.185103 type:complete len:132 (-) comp13603_c0_seq6:1507-1902(-)
MSLLSKTFALWTFHNADPSRLRRQFQSSAQTRRMNQQANLFCKDCFVLPVRLEMNRQCKDALGLVWIYQQDQSGKTALVTASMWGHTAIVKALLANGADVHVKIISNKAKQHSIAKSLNRVHIVELLQEYQ